MSKTEELLKVLDTPEYEQFEFLCNRELIDIADYEEVISAVTEERRDFLIDRILADLAFRLREEAISEDSDIWAKSCWYVQQWISFHKIQTWNIPSFDGLNNAEHEILTKEPIVWIITALIANPKEKP